VNPDLLIPAALALVAVLALAVLAVLLRDRSQVRAELAATRAEAAELWARVDALAVQIVASRREPEEFVITHLGEDGFEPFETGAHRPPEGPTGARPHGPEDQRIDGKLFADLVLRETAVKAAALGHGVRRAMAPEARNRIRFEIKREIKRSRRDRRAETKQVRREMQDRRRQAEGLTA
jgi:hypothetical protein